MWESKEIALQHLMPQLSLTQNLSWLMDNDYATMSAAKN